MFGAHSVATTIWRLWFDGCRNSLVFPLVQAQPIARQGVRLDDLFYHPTELPQGRI